VRVSAGPSQREGVIPNERDVVIRNQVRDLVRTADHVWTSPEPVLRQAVDRDVRQPVLREHRREKVEVLGIDAVEMQREPERIFDVHAGDGVIPIRRQHALGPRVNDHPPGEGDVRRGHGLAVGPAQARPQPVGDIHAPGGAVPGDVAILQGRNSQREVRDGLQVTVPPYETGVEE